MTFPLKDRLIAAGFALRGYNLTNLGRTPELLAHRAYGPTVERWLREASEICSSASGQKIDLVERVKAGRESTLDTFAEDIGLIMSVELAQLELLREFFGIEFSKARLAMGYSLGEVAALVACGVFEMADVLTPLASFAADCVKLAENATMGVLFSRGPVLNLEAVERLCVQVTCEGHGTVAISSYLAPNTVLLIGQNDTLDLVKNRLSQVLGEQVHLRKNTGRWPPLHTPLLRDCSIPNRAAVAMRSMPHGLVAPQPPILSLVTGKTSYNDFNSRETLTKWLDHPQKLWDVLYEILSVGVEVLVHVGPEPNLIPATFKRISDNVTAQFSGTRLKRLRMSTMRGIGTRAWLTKVLPGRVALLRAPFLVHVILEDWLLEQEVK